MNKTEQAHIATHKAVDDKVYKALSVLLPKGVTPIDTTIRIVGGLKKGDPYEQRIPQKANPWALLAKALSKLNAASVESLVQEALAVSDEEASAIKDTAQEALDRISDATVVTISGRVTATLALEVLQ